MLECGVCELDITPPLGMPIPGYFSPRPAVGILDNLYAKAVVIGDGSRYSVLLALDSIGIEKEETAAIRERITEATGIPASNILVAATHTHTGGPVYRDRPPEGNEYVAFLIKKAADAAITAFRNKAAARIGFSLGAEAGISFNRRYFMKDGSLRTNPGFGNPDIVEPAGPIDPDVIVIRIDDAAGAPLGVVANFACHPDTLGGRRYSADYPGEIARLLKKVYGGSFVSLFLNGACGNINHLDFIGKPQPDPGAYRTMGAVLAGEIIKLREKTATVDTLSVDGRSAGLIVDVRTPTPEQLAAAEEHIRLQNTPQVTEAEVFFARHLMTLKERGETNTEVEIQALKLGSTAVVAFPCELFVEFGLELKKRSPFRQTVAAGYANGVNGYVATQEAFVQGGYETRLTSRTRLAPDSGERMVNTALELLTDLFESDGGVQD